MVPRIVPPGEGKVLQVLGETYTFKAVGEETGGAYALVEIATPPQLGPPLHVHRREDEGFYVLAGEYAIQVGDRRITATSGSFAFLPRNIPHT